MTSQASLSLSLSLSPPLTKVTDAQYRKRFRASYNASVSHTNKTVKPKSLQLLSLILKQANFNLQKQHPDSSKATQYIRFSQKTSPQSLTVVAVDMVGGRLHWACVASKLYDAHRVMDVFLGEKIRHR